MHKLTVTIEAETAIGFLQAVRTLEIALDAKGLDLKKGKRVGANSLEGDAPEKAFVLDYNLEEMKMETE